MINPPNDHKHRIPAVCSGSRLEAQGPLAATKCASCRRKYKVAGVLVLLFHRPHRLVFALDIFGLSALIQDLFASKCEDEKAISATNSATANKAYQTLTHPMSRVKYLVRPRVVRYGHTHSVLLLSIGLGNCNFRIAVRSRILPDRCIEIIEDPRTCIQIISIYGGCTQN